MSPELRNPFEYDAANNLTPEMVVDYYIEDFNYARFIQTKRNVLLVGERGCGKTMTLLYNAWPIQKLRAAKDGREPSLDLIGVYVPCNTPLTHKTEYQLLGDFQASIISEHFLVLAIAHAIVTTLADVPRVMDGADEADVRAEVEYIFSTQLPTNLPFFESVTRFIQRELGETQRSINSDKTAEVRAYENTFTFASVVVPILSLVSRLPMLRSSHFMLLIDDAHALNEYQSRALNSWIAYRDHSLFSFKVALAKIGRKLLTTSSGGTILEGHDYVQVDLEQPFQNEASNFGRLAEQLVKRRLEKIGVSSTPDEFFPVSSRMTEELAASEAVVRSEAEARYGEAASGKISDYVYKYKRAHYFRSRHPKANRPEYSGFPTLVFLSTGVIRNLLQPCYWMYDQMLSLMSEQPEGDQSFESVLPSVQSEIVLGLSRKMWDALRDGLDQSVEGCSREDAIQAFRLLDNLAMHFRERLMRHKSEPTANSFTISGSNQHARAAVDHLIEILRKAQIIYARSGSAKDKGKREVYYVPNRMLWPDRGLDPHGQHARVSLSATDLYNAAKDNRPIPFEDDTPLEQEMFWHE